MIKENTPQVQILTVGGEILCIVDASWTVC